MPPEQTPIEDSLKIAWPIVFVGAGIGFVLSWGVLSGDQLGRVNLFYLLLVYLIIPIASVLASAISLVFGRGINLARLLARVPFWSFQNQTLIRKIQQLKLDKHWFLMQSQAAAIAFSFSSLLTFFVLLLATDINFVWRSTILEAADILPFLEFIARPWSFWQAAQPDIALLEMTQDSRLVGANARVSVYASWWQFILATQLVYSLILRIVLLGVSRWWLTRLLAADLELCLQTQINQHTPLQKEKFEIAPVVYAIPSGIAVNNWAGVQIELLESLPELNLESKNLLIAGPQATQAQQSVAERWQGDQVVIVKAWEPPLGELQDFLQNGQGYLLPLDWNDTGLIKPRKAHLQEWQRLINNLPKWQLYQPEQL